MLKMHSLFLILFLLTLSKTLNAQQEEMRASTQELMSNPVEYAQNTSTRTHSFTGVITGSKVRMRVSPSLEGHVVRETKQGDLFVVAGETNDYYAVIPPKDIKGYVFRTFILDGVVEAERVNVRLYPDIDAPVVGQLNTGDKVATVVSDVNSKWLEVNLPENSRFYIAKEYIENKGPLELFAKVEKRRNEASHLLSAATLFAQAEIQKPFEQIDYDCISEKLIYIAKEYHDLPSIVEQVRDASSLVQDMYVQKKVAFLEGKIHFKPSSVEIEVSQYDNNDLVSASSKSWGLAPVAHDNEITDKMLVWQPLEEALYHLWAMSHGERGQDAFYQEEEQAAQVLSGIVEPYNRPVKNRPGDFLLRNESMPVAFLYSTRVNLEKLVGQKITVLAAPRPNHNFAFPAYFVISVE